MNELQKRIIFVLQNLEGAASVHDLRVKGNIPKTPGVLEANLRSLAREGYVNFSKRNRVWQLKRVPRKDIRRTPQGTSKRRIRKELVKNPKATLTQIGRVVGLTTASVKYHVDKLKAEEPELFNVAKTAGDKFLNMNVDKKPELHIYDFQEKHDALLYLEQSQLVKPEIKPLLAAIRSDLAYLNSFDKDAAI